MADKLAESHLSGSCRSEGAELRLKRRVIERKRSSNKITLVESEQVFKRASNLVLACKAKLLSTWLTLHQRVDRRRIILLASLGDSMLYMVPQR